MIELRPYQDLAVKKIRQEMARLLALKGKVRVLLVMPCGSGKTVVFSHIAYGANKLNKKATIIAHRKELITQCSKKLKAFEVDHGIIKDGFEKEYDKNIQVASIQTLRSRKDVVRPDIIVIDEAHHSAAKSYQDVIDENPQAILLGVTASPTYGNRRTMHGYYDALVKGPTIKELVNDGYLVHTRLFAPPPKCDLSQVDIVNGEYVKDQLEGAMNKPVITGDAVEHYKRIAEGLPAIVFTVNVKHAHDVADTFRKAGYAFYAIDGTMDDDERDKLLEDFANGDIMGLCSCDLISEGTDIPSAVVAIKLRPSYSEVIDIQQNGRINRPSYTPGMPLDTADQRKESIAASKKPYGYVIDHVNNMSIHGMPEDDRDWSLTEQSVLKRAGGGIVPVQRCPSCYEVFPPFSSCPNCGITVPVKERKMLYTEGQLKEIKAEDIRKKKELAEQKKKDKKKELKAAKTLDELIRFGIKYEYEDPESWAKMWLKMRARYKKNGR